MRCIDHHTGKIKLPRHHHARDHANHPLAIIQGWFDKSVMRLSVLIFHTRLISRQHKSWKLLPRFGKVTASLISNFKGIGSWANVNSALEIGVVLSSPEIITTFPFFPKRWRQRFFSLKVALFIPCAICRSFPDYVLRTCKRRKANSPLSNSN